MRNLIQPALTLLKGKQDFVLATIIALKGSAPCGPGAHMLFTRDGKIYGTIGGGLLEALVAQQALKVFADHHRRILTYNLEAGKALGEEMNCGGQIEVLMYWIDAEQEVYLRLYEALKDAMDLGQALWLLTPLEGVSPPALLSENGAIIGEVAGDMDPKSMLEKAKGIFAVAVWPDLGLIIEPLLATSVAYVFGAGHIAHYLVPLLAMVGFKTVVIDDRSEFANKERFSTADRIILADLDNVAKQLNFDQKSYLVIITRGHLHDKEVLAQVLRGPAAYIGMIGSRTKRQATYEQLLEQGYSLADLQRVHSPIGLKIQAEGPAEIAISIAAEMIAVRAKGRPRSRQCP